MVVTEAASRVGSRLIRRSAIAMVAAVFLTGCASTQYMGISFRPGAADPAVQALAAKAQGGDKQSQYELGRWFEGSTDPDGRKKAIMLYRISATPRGGARLLYLPGASGVTTSVVSTGPLINANESAKIRLRQLSMSAKPDGSQEYSDTDVSREESWVKFKVKASELTSSEELDSAACVDFRYELEDLYESEILDCQAYRYEFQYRSKMHIVYDFEISIPIEVAKERGYPTNLVDPVELGLDSALGKYFIIEGRLLKREGVRSEAILIENVRGIR